jgi:hypothetical protein
VLGRDDPLVVGAIWADRKPGSNPNATRIGKQLPRIPVRKRLNPALKPDRRPNANLVIIETEAIDITAVLAVQVIDPCAQPPGNQHVKRRFDKPVIIIPRRADVTVSGDVV